MYRRLSTRQPTSALLTTSRLTYLIPRLNTSQKTVLAAPNAVKKWREDLDEQRKKKKKQISVSLEPALSNQELPLLDMTETKFWKMEAIFGSLIIM